MEICHSDRGSADDGKHALKFPTSHAIKGGGLRGEGQRDGARPVADLRIWTIKNKEKPLVFKVFTTFCDLGSKMRQDVAKMRQERPKISQERRKLSQDRLQHGPRECQDRAKLGQDAAKMAQDGTKSLDFGGFWLSLKLYEKS